MSLSICIPRRKARVELMLSSITLLKNGIYDHVVTFLITNKGDQDSNELLILYPKTFQQDAKPESILKTFKEQSRLNRGENELDWEIHEAYVQDDASPFNRYDPNSEGYDYRGLSINGVRYHGYIKYEPSIDRVNVGIDLLHKFTSNTDGYSIFKVKFDDDYPIKKDVPIWVRIKFTVDSQSKGIIERWGLGLISNPKYAYQFYDPIQVKEIFFQEIVKMLEEDVEDNSGLEELIKYVDHIRTKRTTLVEYFKYHFYVRFKEIEEDSNPVRNCTLKLENVIISGCKDRCYKLTSDNLSNLTTGCTTNVYAKEEKTWPKVLKLLKGSVTSYLGMKS